MTTALCKPGTKRLIDAGAAAEFKATAVGTDDQEAWYQATLDRAKRYRALVKRQAVGQVQTPVMPIGEARRQMDNLKRWLDDKDGFADPDPFGPAVFRW